MHYRYHKSKKEMREDLLEEMARRIVWEGDRSRRKERKNRSFSPSPNKRKTFYASWEWKKMRMKALQKHGHACQSCGAGPKHGARVVVDHIKPLDAAWNLRLDLDNLQVLCDDCNRGKGNWLEADFRGEGIWAEDDPLTSQFKAIMRE